MSDEQHPAVLLWRKQSRFVEYPVGVLPVPAPIPGTSFFPGGFGLWNSAMGQPLPPFPVEGCMVLGHDFHSEAGYRASVKRGREDANQPTWRNMVSLLNRAGVPLDRCFFTNYYMGLRQGSATTGPFPGRTDATFVAWCRSFFIEQLRVQRPRLIITLGVSVPPGIAPLSRQLEDWGRGIGIRHLDSVGALRRDVSFDGLPSYVTTVVALIHPSLRHASLRHRRFGSLSGDDAEVALLKSARSAAEQG